MPSTRLQLNYVAETNLTRVQIGVSIDAVVVKTERLALTVVVILCQCHEMDVTEERVAIKFSVKSVFQLQRLWN
jgi:hypothetical protein